MSNDKSKAIQIADKLLPELSTILRIDAEAAGDELRRLDAVNRELLEALQAIADSVLGGGEIKRKPDSDGYYSEPIHQDEMARVLATIAKATDV